MPIAATKDNLKLNEYLVGRRRFLKLKFGDLSSKTGIPAKHLKKIENGDWLNLPPGVYAKGFLKKYARGVGLDEGEVCFRYEHELVHLDANQSSTGFPNNKGLYGWKSWPMLDVISRSSFRKILILFLTAAAAGYMFWQFKAVLEKPKLVLEQPTNEDIVLNESKVKLVGRTSPGAVLTINNETIYPDSGGAFAKEVELLDGLNVLEIKTVSRFGKENKITRRVTYNP